MLEEGEDTTSNYIPLTDVAAHAHKGRKKRYILREIQFWLGTVFSGSFGLMSMHNLTLVLGYFLSILIIPFEIIKLATQVENLIHRKAAWYLIAGALLMGALTLFYFAASDALKWGAHVGFLSGFIAASPVIFTPIFGLMTIASSASFFKSLYDHYKRPHLTTPIRKANLIGKGVNSGALLVMTAFIMPFVLFPQFMPIFLTIMLVAFTTMLVMKIIKAVHENQVWKKTLKELEGEDPYDVLFSPGDAKKYKNKLHEEVEHKKDSSFFAKLKDSGLHFVNKIRGIEEEGTAAADIKASFESKMGAASNDVDRLKIQKCFDLLRKTRGRLLEHETLRSNKKAKLSHSMPVVVVDKANQGDSSGDVLTSQWTLVKSDAINIARKNSPGAIREKITSNISFLCK